MCVNVLWKLETPCKGVLITLKIYTLEIKKGFLGTPDGLVVKNTPSKARDVGLIPGQEL